jgi:hypothetical protein
LSKRHAYVRVVERIDHLAVPIEVIVGVELHKLLTVKAQYDDVRTMIRRALSPTMLRNYSDDALTEVIERHIQALYPGRSYFIEIGRGNLDEYVQVYVP